MRHGGCIVDCVSLKGFTTEFDTRSSAVCSMTDDKVMGR